MFQFDANLAILLSCVPQRPRGPEATYKLRLKILENNSEIFSLKYYAGSMLSKLKVNFPQADLRRLIQLRAPVAVATRVDPRSTKLED